MITDPDTKVRTSLQQIGLGPSTRVKIHTCLSVKLYALFKNDVDALVLRGIADFTEDQAACQCLIANGGTVVCHIICLTSSFTDWTVPQSEIDGNSDSDSEDEVVEILSPIQESRPLRLSNTFDFDDYHDDAFNFYPTSPVASGSGATSSRILRSVAQQAADTTLIPPGASDTTSTSEGSALVSGSTCVIFLVH